MCSVNKNVYKLKTPIKNMMKKDDDFLVSETGNWNVAADYSRLKIMKPLFLSDEYVNIAKFGSSTLVEDLINQFNNINSDVLKLKGFERLIDCLIMLIDNSKFAIKNNKDLEELEEYRKQLKRIEKLLPYLSKTTYNQMNRTKTIKIIPDKFNNLLEAAINIKSNINTPLNKSHLIFTDKEEFDPIAYKKNIIKQATTRG